MNRAPTVCGPNHRIAKRVAGNVGARFIGRCSPHPETGGRPCRSPIHRAIVFLNPNRIPMRVITHTVNDPGKHRVAADIAGNGNQIFLAAQCAIVKSLLPDSPAEGDADLGTIDAHGRADASL